MSMYGDELARHALGMRLWMNTAVCTAYVWNVGGILLMISSTRAFAKMRCHMRSTVEFC